MAEWDYLSKACGILHCEAIDTPCIYTDQHTGRCKKTECASTFSSYKPIAIKEELSNEEPEGWHMPDSRRKVV